MHVFPHAARYPIAKLPAVLPRKKLITRLPEAHRACVNMRCVSSNSCDTTNLSCEFMQALPGFAGSGITSHPMKAHLIQAASQVIPDQHILVNMVSRRVRQLSFGHRPMVQISPGMLAADIALTEIVEKKLAYESTFGEKDAGASVVLFPGETAVTKKAA